jgi:hypothetical protein
MSRKLNIYSIILVFSYSSFRSHERKITKPSLHYNPVSVLSSDYFHSNLPYRRQINSEFIFSVNSQELVCN